MQTLRFGKRALRIAQEICQPVLLVVDHVLIVRVVATGYFNSLAIEFFRLGEVTFFLKSKRQVA